MFTFGKANLIKQTVPNQEAILYMSIHYKIQFIKIKRKYSGLFFPPLSSVLSEDHRKMFSNHNHPQKHHSNYYLCMRKQFAYFLV